MLVVKIRSGNSADDEVARRVSVKSADDVEHGRFAATARAENSHKFALSEIERNFSQCMHGCRRGGIIFYYVFKLKHIAPQKNALFYILFNNVFTFLNDKENDGPSFSLHAFQNRSPYISNQSAV